MFDAPVKPQLGRVVAEKSHDGLADLLVLKRPIKFTAVADETTESPIGWQRGSPPHITGEIDFGLHVYISKQEHEAGNSIWQLKLGRKKRAELVSFACGDYSRCEEIRDFLQE